MRYSHQNTKKQGDNLVFELWEVAGYPIAETVIGECYMLFEFDNSVVVESADKIVLQFQDAQYITG